MSNEIPDQVRDDGLFLKLKKFVMAGSDPPSL